MEQISQFIKDSNGNLKRRKIKSNFRDERAVKLSCYGEVELCVVREEAMML